MSGITLLHTIEEAGVAVLTLTEGLEDEELLNSRLTRAEVQRQLKRLTEAAMRLPHETRKGMPEVDWAGLQAADSALSGVDHHALNQALVTGFKELTPGLLMWLRVYRQQQQG